MSNTFSEACVRGLLSDLGLDIHDEHLVDTPHRIAKFWRAWLAEGEQTFRFTTFEADETDDMVMTGNIRFYSMCSHHFVPFFGYAHIAYLPNGRLAGLSKLARAVRMFAHRPQVQERLTRQVAEFLNEQLRPDGVSVVMQAEHLCMSMRGVEVPGHQTVTEFALGDLRRPTFSKRFHDYICMATGGYDGRNY